MQLRHQNVPQDAKKQAHIDTNNQPTNQQNKQREKQINKQPHKHTTQANKPSNKQTRKHHTKHTKHKPTNSLKPRLGPIASDFKEKSSRGRVLAEGDVDPPHLVRGSRACWIFVIGTLHSSEAKPPPPSAGSASAADLFPLPLQVVTFRTKTIAQNFAS